MRISEEGGVRNDFEVSNLENWMNVMFFTEVRNRECESMADTKFNRQSLYPGVIRERETSQMS